MIATFLGAKFLGAKFCSVQTNNLDGTRMIVVMQCQVQVHKCPNPQKGLALNILIAMLRRLSKRLDEFSDPARKRIRYNTSKANDSTIESIKRLSNVILSKPMQFRENRLADPRSMPAASKYVKRSENEVRLLTKFDTEVLASSEAMNTLKSLRLETQEKYLYQIRRYIRHCANKGLEDFFVTKEMARELIQHELNVRGQISENTIKSIRSPLNKLYIMNRIVYSESQISDPLCDLMDDLADSLAGNAISGVSDCCESGYGFEVRGTESPGIIKFSDQSKKTLTESEVALLKKYEREILNSEKTNEVLQNLAGSTFKAYSVDIKRFVKFCGRKCLNNFLLNRDILKEFLRLELENKANALTKFKSLRRSLLKLNQLNCLAYDVAYSEEELISNLNTILDQVKNGTCDEKCLDEEETPKGHVQTETLVDSFNRQFKHSSSLDDLSPTSKRLHYAEMRRYVIFCSQERRANFDLEGNFLKKYLVTSILSKFPEISRKKIREIVSRLVKLHEMSGTSAIVNFDVVEKFISEYQPRSKVIIKQDNDFSLAKEPCLTITYTEKPLDMDPEKCLQLRTVSQLVNCFISVQEELKAPPPNADYNDLKSVILLVEELIYEGFAVNGPSPREEICQILDEYITDKKLTLQELAVKVHKFPTHTRREFQRMMTRRSTSS